MQEIYPHIFIENSYPGVTLGAISWPHGLILIDAPFRPDDARAWRAALLNLGGGVDRMLVNLDAHVDRTLGVRQMDFTVVGHDKLADIFRNRPLTFKAQAVETGAEWEMHEGLGSIRWLPPEITFTHCFTIHWDGGPVNLEYHPGPSAAAIWAVLPENRVVFVGDTVVPNQPPFLAHCQLPEWIEQLEALAGPDFRSYLMISGRGGVVTQDDVRKQLRFLQNVSGIMQDLAARSAPVEEVEKLADDLLASFQPPPNYALLYQNRLRYGLRQYYLRSYHPAEVAEAED